MGRRRRAKLSSPWQRGWKAHRLRMRAAAMLNNGGRRFQISRTRLPGRPVHLHVGVSELELRKRGRPAPAGRERAEPGRRKAARRALVRVRAPLRPLAFPFYRRTAHEDHPWLPAHEARRIGIFFLRERMSASTSNILGYGRLLIHGPGPMFIPH